MRVCTTYFVCIAALFGVDVATWDAIAGSDDEDATTAATRASGRTLRSALTPLTPLYVRVLWITT
jgi:hypothetical protein